MEAGNGHVSDVASSGVKVAEPKLASRQAFNTGSRKWKLGMRSFRGLRLRVRGLGSVGGSRLESVNVATDTQGFMITFGAGGISACFWCVVTSKELVGFLEISSRDYKAGKLSTLNFKPSPKPETSSLG